MLRKGQPNMNIGQSLPVTVYSSYPKSSLPHRLG